MRTNIDIDDELVKEAMKILNVRTKKEAVELGLRMVRERAARDSMRSLRGKVEMFPEDGSQAKVISK